MAKTTISPTDQSKLRSEQSIDNLALCITPLVHNSIGTITAIPNKYPTTSLTIDWTTGPSNVEVGQMIRITDGSTIKAYSVVRKPISGSTLYINETPLGALGYPADIEQPILVGDTVTIYTHEP